MTTASSGIARIAAVGITCLRIIAGATGLALALVGCGGGGGGVGGPVATALPSQFGIEAPAAARAGEALTLRPAGLATGSDLVYEWRFGDGGQAASREVQHTWALPGSYEVVLTVRNGAGQSASTRSALRIEAAVTALPAQLVIDGPVAGHTGQALTWRPAGLAEGSDLTFAWSFGDSTQAVTREASRSFDREGAYELSLTVRNGAGQTVSARLALRIDVAAPTREALVAGLECTGSTPGSGWCVQYPSQRPRRIHEFQFGGPGVVMGVGDEGTVLVSTDSGLNWQRRPEPLGRRVPLQSLRLTADNRAYVVQEGRLLVSGDLGGSWRESAEVRVARPDRTIIALPGGKVAVTTTGDTAEGIRFSEDGALTWRMLDPGLSLPNAAPDDVFAMAPSGIVLVGRRFGGPAPVVLGEFGRTRVGELPCEPVHPHRVGSYALRAPTAQSIVVIGHLTCGAQTGLHRLESTDGGRHWTQTLVQAQGRADDLLAFVDENIVYAETTAFPPPGNRAFAQISLDGGFTWRTVAEPAHALTPLPAPGGPVLARSTARGAVISQDHGLTWRDIGVPAEGAPMHTLRHAGGGLWLAGAGGAERWYVSRDDARTWAVVPGGRYTLPDGRGVEIAFTAAGLGVAITASGEPRITRDGGRTWAAGIPTADHVPAGRFRMGSDGDGRLLFDGRLYRSGDGGRTWRQPAPPSELLATGVRLSGQGAVFADLDRGLFLAHLCSTFTCDDAGAWKTTDGGSNWTREKRSELRWLAPIDGAVTYAVEASALRLRASIDGWRTWTERLLPDRPVELSSRSFDANVPPLAIFPAPAEGVWIQGVSGTLFRSSDGGSSWNAVAPPAGTPVWPPVRTLRFANADTGWLVPDLTDSEEQYVLHTRDGGRSWSRQPMPWRNPQRLVVHDDQVLWGLTADGYVVVSVTGGR